MSIVIEVIKAIILGLVEGFSEWLPISSTGHMIIVDEFVHLDVSSGFKSLFLVVIQLGAILAVVILYFDRLYPFARQKNANQQRATWMIWKNVVIGCMPAAVIGVLLDDWVDEHFYRAVVVAAMLIVYGVGFILVERFKPDKPASRHFRARRSVSNETTESLDLPTVVKIGLFQCLAIIPGTSRSGATILGARLLGISRPVATEFSFFLAIPVMLGWSLLKTVKVLLIDKLQVTATEWLLLVVGVVVAFTVSVFVIRFLVDFVKKNSFAVFGWYRIALGVLLLIFFGITGGLF